MNKQLQQNWITKKAVYNLLPPCLQPLPKSIKSSIIRDSFRLLLPNIQMNNTHMFGCNGQQALSTINVLSWLCCTNQCILYTCTRRQYSSIASHPFSISHTRPYVYVLVRCGSRSRNVSTLQESIFRSLSSHPSIVGLC